ncbi:sugar ABC transporter ATP-binding protein [Shinella sumterensis]|nr:sugar ABC transporter ATP-binding protein [Shinella sumterensis]MCD1265391.1 ATP-binding cassette domain-containing protein [Shinella sumterensis]TFE93764.1 sugar ABC transporter ATP-binding protein [Shinella sumterensis]
MKVFDQTGPVSGQYRPETDALLSLSGVTKQYPGVLALADFDFDLRAGEVHVLFGENGAGKSTMISMIAGASRPSAGEIRLRGELVDFRSVQLARRAGVRAVFQEFSLVPELTVEENIFLGQEASRGPFLDKAELRQRARAILDHLGFDLKNDQPVAYLSRADQQMVEIAKAFVDDIAVLILDEPTASLTEKETDRLFALVDAAKKNGTGVIYITHRMAEIKRLGDRVTVLRDGRKIATLDAQDISEERLIELMTGRVIEQVFPNIGFAPAALMLEIENLTLAGGVVRDASIQVRAGEVVGIAGLVGCGKGEIGRAAFGLERVRAGRIRFKGRDTTGHSPSAMLKDGMFYLPSDRRNEGLVMARGGRENIALSSLDDNAFTRFGFLKRSAEAKITQKLAQDVELRPMDLERSVDQFSGGNQQKIVIAKALARKIDFFIFDEPTVGVDVGTRVAIYALIRDLCEAGAGILLISSDLPEILHLSHRAYVMYRGTIRSEIAQADLSQENLLSHFFERDAS